MVVSLLERRKSRTGSSFGRSSIPVPRNTDRASQTHFDGQSIAGPFNKKPPDVGPEAFRSMIPAEKSAPRFLLGLLGSLLSGFFCDLLGGFFALLGRFLRGLLCLLFLGLLRRYFFCDLLGGFLGGFPGLLRDGLASFGGRSGARARIIHVFDNRFIVVH